MINMSRFITAVLLSLFLATAPAAERQLTFSPITKALDNNDNFSRDGQFLVYDTRDTVDAGPANSTRIMKASVITGEESDVYRPPSVTGAQAAPGLAAASWSPVTDEILFIHGPLLKDTPRLGFYSQTNRRGAIVRADGKGEVRFLDWRDVESAVTPPGAHRGGTHRHEFSADGNRVGFTYDDQLLRAYGRNIGVLIPHPKAPGGVSHYFVVLLPIVPAADAKPGDLVRAADDSWVGAQGLMRAFIGQVKTEDGGTASSLFVVDIPADIDITTSDSGTATRYPTPPKGLKVRKLAEHAAPGIVRGSPDGAFVAYYAKDGHGVRQVFLAEARDPGKRSPTWAASLQATTLPEGAASGLRWHPSGNSIAVISDNGVAAICVRPGPLFGKTVWLTRHGVDAPPAEALVWSHDGKLLAFNRRVPTTDSTGRVVKDATGGDFRQIFLVEFPDVDGDGIADAVEGAR